MNPRVKAVQYRDPYELVITFNNDEHSISQRTSNTPFIKRYKTLISAARQRFFRHSSLG